MTVFGVRLGPPAAAETAYLAILATAVLLALGGLGSTRALWLGAPLVTVAVWVLPLGPVRGAVVMAILVSLLVLGATRSVSAAIASGGRPTVAGAYALLLPLALGAQFLLRGERLVDVELSRDVVGGLLVLPAVAALALAVTASRRGLPPALLAGAGAAVLGAGFNVVATLALAAVAAGCWLAPAPPFGARGPRTAARWTGVLVAVAAVAAPIVWDPRAAVLGAVAAAIATGLPAAVAVGAAAALVLALAAPAAGWAAVARVLSWVVLLLPALPWALVLPKTFGGEGGSPAPGGPTAGGRGSAVAGLLLAVAAARMAVGPAALAAPVAILALGLPWRRPLAGPQAVWSTALLAGSALLAGYPWLRPAPAIAALELAALTPGWRASGLVVGAVGFAALAAAAIAAAGRRLGLVNASGATRLFARSGVWAGALLAAGLVVALPAPPAEIFAFGIPVLDAAHPRFAVDLSGSPVAGVVVESNMSHAAELPAGTRVAEVRLLDAGGEPLAAWDLIAGRDTGEWATRRADLAGRPGLTAPTPWLAWVEVERGRAFFGERFRVRLAQQPPVAAGRLEVLRDFGLPPRVTLSLYRLETLR